MKLFSNIFDKKSKKWLLIASIFIFSIAGVVDFFEKPSTHSTKYAKKVQAFLLKMESDVDAIVSDERFLGDFESIKNIKEGGEDIFEKPFTFNVFYKDSLVFWNNVDIGDNEKAHAVLHKEGNKLLRLPNGYFYVREDRLHNGKEIVTFFPIKYHYNLEGIYLKDIFAVDKFKKSSVINSIPADKVDVIIEGEGTPIYNKGGKEIFKIHVNTPIKSVWLAYLLFILYLIAGILGLFWLTNTAQKISRTKSPLLGIIFLGGVLLVVRMLMLYSNYATNFEVIPLFTEKYSTIFFMDTLGDMLLNASVALWVAIFFHREFTLVKIDKLSTNIRFIGAVFSYSFIILGILSITYILKSLVLETDIPFDFENIAELQLGSFISILGILFLMLMLFLFTHRISLTIRDLNLHMHKRLIALAISVGLVFTIAIVLNLALPLLLLLLFSIIYVISFDLYVEKKSTNLTWIVVWLMIYSAFSSAFLYKYNILKEQNIRVNYAKFLTHERDSDVEKKLEELGEQIQVDKDILHHISDSLEHKKISKILERNHTIDIKFIDYNSKIYLFKKDSLQNISSLNKGNIALLKHFDKQDILLEENLRFAKEDNTLGTYYLKIEYPDIRQETIILLLEFDRVIGREKKVYTEIFINDDYQKFKGLEDYEYAIYRNNELVIQEGSSYADRIEDLSKMPKKGSYSFVLKGNYSHLIFHADNENIAMLKKELPHFWPKFRSLFSYLFTIMVVVLSILILINTMFQALPSGLGSIYNLLPSLKNKIQVSVIAIIILSFLVIGVVTIVFFEQKNDDYHAGRLGRKAKSITSDVAMEIEQMNISTNSLDKFKEIITPISNIHRMDISVYTIDGRLLASSGNDIFTKGLVSSLINPKAYHALSIERSDKIVMEQEKRESIGLLEYEAQYEPLKDINKRVIAYLGMPYYSQQSKIQDDTSDFIGTLLNYYVVLLLFAGAIAIGVANSITRPITQMGEKLKQVKLGKRNEPLEWTSKDELGELIGEYNRMIKKLDDSAQLLAQSERESAWREMAKQVAHEIKNPLTPMKLSIQYLQHAYDANPQNMDSMLKRVSHTLIEQIDNLSYIATEFSNFAKMPRAENEQFAVNYLVQSVYDLFSERDDIDMNISLEKEELMVFADKNQLMRVFNNLINNAIQAIPEERKGKISVILRKREDNIVQLEVKDNGCGISEDMEEFIFVPHITTKSSGTGLGLAISKSIIEALDGSIYFKSTHNIGTSFFVELPISKE